MIYETIEQIDPLGFSGYTIGERVYAVGHPRVRLLEPSPLLVLDGIVSGELGSLEDATRQVVTSCQTAPGNSGGPIVNEFGSFVGLVEKRYETQLADGSAEFGTFIPWRLLADESLENRVSEFEL
jgi:S1-C subfamily serine protease